ncbi:MAG TPA: vanadium-dependent haloperoxidase [Candidatus Angelobacter sp.]|nr:vanadium-dependent haloperoxidase [Candidatus Angelobacter sp.]
MILHKIVGLVIHKIAAMTIAVSLTAAFAAQEVAQTGYDDRTSDQEYRPQEDAAFTHLKHFFYLDPALVVAWNQVIYEIAYAEDQFFTFKGHRAFAMTHIAVHDALNSIIPLYRRFAYHGNDLFAHPIAAAAQAAHDVVLAQYPGEQARLDAELSKWFSRIPDGPNKMRGIALGKQSAAAILALRVGDGWDFQGTYTFSNEPGDYQTTPPWNGLVAQPGFRFAKPFGLRTPDQFRPPPPPALDSAKYAAAYNEVKDFGRVDSVVRTVDQTRYAVWWMEFTEGSVNRLTRQLVTQRGTHLWQAARLFALLNMSIYDSYVAVWDCKFEYNHWRPYTAIREAARDENPATEADPNWEALRTTLPFPDYASAHSTACGATFEILKRSLGDRVSFTMETTTAPPEMPTRSFRSFSSAAAECADSRVRLGWHFRYATNHGLALGRTIAEWLDENHLEFRGAFPKHEK